eukprot:TRINITY_DN29942_c1_g1_i1.p2 TRINITY_DN29942_c1_g1~~TRINITY_DN29942_c1_g1_i1.p2  ORF type:complete len:776 (+),score=419.17 TRINITY_DN29942_c1_g1_i1:24-2330(+)
MDFVQIEEHDGVRFSWNVWPSTRLEAARMAVPVAAMYSPLKNTEGLARVQYPPIRCKQETCKCVLNPYCRVDFLNKIWVCPFCLTRNHFPHHYADISPENLPAEIIPNFTTMEYVIDERSVGPPVFMFVIDTVNIVKELDSLKQSLVKSLNLLPQDALVGLITFGKNVHVHELSFEDCLKSFVFRGSKEVNAARVAQLLGLNVPQQGSQQEQLQAKAEAAGRFLMPVAEADFTFTAILEDLTPDEWPHKAKERPDRSTGVAMAVATGLLEATYAGRSARIMMFVGGPPTVGPGLVVSPNLEENIRSHHDLVKGKAPHYDKAIKYYTKLAESARNNGHIIDIFACSFDQVGLAEMRVCVEQTGGQMVLDDTFLGDVYLGSLESMFRREVVMADDQKTSTTGDLEMAFAGEIEVLTSREFKVAGAIGTAGSLERKSNSVSESTIGVGDTSAWVLGGLYPNSTVSFYFDIVNSSAQVLNDGRQAYLQIVTRYRHASGRTHMRVTTIAKTFADPKTDQGAGYIKAGFDQEAAAVVMARYAVYKAETEFANDVLRWLDRQLIRLVAKFAQYQPDKPESFRLSPEFSYYPMFMFHLRRSQFLQVFNASPDETAWYRLIVCRENTSNGVLMIQPSLMSYSLDGPAQPAPLDVSAVHPERILVLDTFFNMVVFHGDTINQWKQDGVHELPDYAYFAELLKAPEEDAQSRMKERFPRPKYVFCVQNGSQSRFIMAKLNPSITQNTVNADAGSRPPVFTDDVSLKVFMEHLRKLAVAK